MKETVQKRIASTVVIILTLVFSLPIAVHSQSEFKIEVIRKSVSDNLLKGAISVNGTKIGETYENNALKIQAGEYRGFLRYVSKNGHAVGPLGTIGYEGDFLLEIGNVAWSDGKKRDNLLFHGGNKDTLSKGCIMLGAVPKDADGNRYLPETHPLYKLRKLFYGTDEPISSPNKIIKIKIVDIEQ